MSIEKGNLMCYYLIRGREADSNDKLSKTFKKIIGDLNIVKNTAVLRLIYKKREQNKNQFKSKIGFLNSQRLSSFETLQ